MSPLLDANPKHIVLLGRPDDWQDFAGRTLRARGHRVTHEVDVDAVPNADLVVVAHSRDETIAQLMGRLLRRLGPQRVLVLDGRRDFERLSEALASGAVGYHERLWSDDTLNAVVDSALDRDPPDADAIERRFGAWRRAVGADFF